MKWCMNIFDISGNLGDLSSLLNLWSRNITSFTLEIHNCEIHSYITSNNRKTGVNVVVLVNRF